MREERVTVGRLCVGLTLLAVVRGLGACDEPADAETTVEDSGTRSPDVVPVTVPDPGTVDGGASSPLTVATPTMKVHGINDITLATSTPDAAIHYTLDGTTPDAASPLYSRPIVMPGGTTTVSAFALKEGFLPSAVLRFAFVYDPPPQAVAAPTLNPDGGAFAGPVFVTMQTATPNAIIFYTVDGSVPVVTSTRYDGGPFTIATTTTVHAIAAFPSFINSPTTVATFTIVDGGP